MVPCGISGTSGVTGASGTSGTSGVTGSSTWSADAKAYLRELQRLKLLAERKKKIEKIESKLKI